MISKDAPICYGSFGLYNDDGVMIHVELQPYVYDNNSTSINTH